MRKIINRQGAALLITCKSKKKDIQSIKASIFTSYSKKERSMTGNFNIYREHLSYGRLIFQKRVLSKMKLHPIDLRRHKTSHDESSMGLRHLQYQKFLTNLERIFFLRDLNFQVDSLQVALKGQNEFKNLGLLH